MSKPEQAHSPAAVAVRLALAYQAAQAVHVATELGIPDLLGKGVTTSQQLARQTATHPDMLLRLLRALAAFEVVTDVGEGKFELTPVGHCLRADAAQSVRPLVRMYASEHALHMFASLCECVRSGKNAFEIKFGSPSSFDYVGRHPDLAQVFNDGMSAVSAFTGPAAAKAYDFGHVSHIVDVGGGHGIVLASILRAHPHLRGTLFDLPPVIVGASIFLAQAGLGDRCDAVGGDMFEAVPTGGDLYLLSHVIHNWDDPRALRVLRTCRRAMGSDAALVILDRVMPELIEPSPATQSNVLMDLTMMVRTGGGRERTNSEFETLLAAADLRMERILPMQTSEFLIEATLR